LLEKIFPRPVKLNDIGVKHKKKKKHYDLKKHLLFLLPSFVIAHYLLVYLFHLIVQYRDYENWLQFQHAEDLELGFDEVTTRIVVADVADFVPFCDKYLASPLD
jgi:hypothetical protein